MSFRQADKLLPFIVVVGAVVVVVVGEFDDLFWNRNIGSI